MNSTFMLRLHERAKDEIREAAAWYDGQNQGLGRRFVAAVRDAFDSLEEDPQRFAKLETLARNTSFRRILVRGFPYMVVFEPLEHDVFVYAVAHAARRPNYWRRRKRNDSGE